MGLLRSLELRPPFDALDLVEGLAEQRGRPIQLVPRAFPQPTVFGLWIGTTTADLVFYESDATPDHQRHIVLHELGHILFDHGNDNLQDDVWEELVPSLPSDTVRRALRRSSYDTGAEREAETFASVISEWTGSITALDNRTESEIERAFDDPKGWL
jgi:hypothetical protein